MLIDRSKSNAYSTHHKVKNNKKKTLPLSFSPHNVITSHQWFTDDTAIISLHRINSGRGGGGGGWGAKTLDKGGPV